MPAPQRLLALLVAALPTAPAAAQHDETGAVRYGRDIRPILSDRWLSLPRPGRLDP